MIGNGGLQQGPLAACAATHTHQRTKWSASSGTPKTFRISHEGGKGLSSQQAPRNHFRVWTQSGRPPKPHRRPKSTPHTEQKSTRAKAYLVCGGSSHLPRRNSGQRTTPSTTVNVRPATCVMCVGLRGTGRSGRWCRRVRRVIIRGRPETRSSDQGRGSIAHATEQKPGKRRGGRRCEVWTSNVATRDLGHRYRVWDEQSKNIKLTHRSVDPTSPGVATTAPPVGAYQSSDSSRRGGNFGSPI